MDNNNNNNNTALVQEVSRELEELRLHHSCHETATSFPPACRAYLLSLPGNYTCADCGIHNPDWASVTFGSLLCLNCSGRHRSYGVATSVIRSVDMDAWTYRQVLAMLEGGNEQLEGFFGRHRLGKTSSKAAKRYFTKGARFYATHLRQHISLVAEAGIYKGREASRILHDAHRHHKQAGSKSQEGTSTAEVSSRRMRATISVQ